MSLDNKEVEALAHALGLEVILEARPELVRQAYTSARAMAARLERTEDVADEPGHVFRADNNV